MSRESDLGNLGLAAIYVAKFGGYEDATRAAEELLKTGVIPEASAGTLRDAIYGTFLSGVVEAVRYGAGFRSQAIEDIFMKERALGFNTETTRSEESSKVISIESLRRE